MAVTATSVRGRAAGAAIYADAAGADQLQDLSGRRLRPVTDGEEVVGLQMVDTPGHTSGHIAVFDAGSRVLVAGDAISHTTNGLQGPVLEFSHDKRRAEESVRKLAALEPEVVHFGHGPPVQRDAAAKLHQLARSQ